MAGLLWRIVVTSVLGCGRVATVVCCDGNVGYNGCEVLLMNCPGCVAVEVESCGAGCGGG